MAHVPSSITAYAISFVYSSQVWAPFALTFAFLQPGRLMKKSHCAHVIWTLISRWDMEVCSKIAYDCYPGALQLVWGGHAQAMGGGCWTTWTALLLEDRAELASAWNLDKGWGDEGKIKVGWQSHSGCCTFQPWMAQPIGISHVSKRYIQPCRAQAWVSQTLILPNKFDFSHVWLMPSNHFVIFNFCSLAWLQR